LKRLFSSAVCCSLCLASLAAAQGISWDAAIEAVREKQNEYFEYALGLGSGYPGTALNGLGADQHRCAIAGRILGFNEEIRSAETLEDPPMTPIADPMELMSHAMTLDAWIASAEYVLSLSETARKSLWDLECVGNFGIPSSAYIGELNGPTDFTARDQTLYVYGDIDQGFADRFKSALELNSGVTQVALGSAGGSVVDAIRAGLMIRERGLGTVLVGPCYSACPLVFAGGVRRIIWMGATPTLGFHQVSINGLAVPSDDQSYDLIRLYLAEMGVSPEIVIGWMLSAPPAEIYEPPLDELCMPNLATWIQRTCGS
jgi:hypothetical protein